MVAGDLTAACVRQTMLQIHYLQWNDVAAYVVWQAYRVPEMRCVMTMNEKNIAGLGWNEGGAKVLEQMLVVQLCTMKSMHVSASWLMQLVMLSGYCSP